MNIPLPCRACDRVTPARRPYPNTSGPDAPRRPTRHKAIVVAVAMATVASTLALSASSALASPAANPANPQTVSAVEVGLGALLNRVVAAGVPGILVRVQDGRDVRVATAGAADLVTGAALRPDVRFRVGSITKSFVATVVLQLVGERRLSLDQPVGHWLPGLLADGDRIIVRELLNHTSGLFNYTADPTLLAGIVSNRVWNPAELVGIAECHPSSFPPGSAWGYSNTNYIVAGLLIETVTHHPLTQELQQRIFKPLNLQDTSFPVATGKIRGYHAHGYVPTTFVPTADGNPLDVTGFNPSHAWAAGAIVSSADDLSRFYRALMGGKLLSPGLLAEMKTTVAEDPADPTYFRYGLGIERVQDPCGANWGHPGAIFGYQSMAFWNETTNRTVAIAETMSPMPPAADAPLASATDVALCGPATGPANDSARAAR